MVKFYLNTDLFTKEYKETGINRTAYYAVKNRLITGNKLLDFNETIRHSDIPEIVDTLKRMGETEFTISTIVSKLVETLAEFKKFGVDICGMTDVNSKYLDCYTGIFERRPAILMKVTR